MFLTKKNSGQPKQKQKNSKALGGWDDDQPQHTTPTQINKISNTNYIKLNQNKTFGNNSQYKSTNINKVINTDLLNDDQVTVVGNTYQNFQLQKVTHKIENKVKNNNSQNTNLYAGQQLAQMTNIECQCKIVQRVLAPGGIRVKQTDSMLNQFQSQAKNLNISIIGSLLIAYLYNNDIGFQIKARSLYAIQYLCKKNIQYSVYFKMYVNQIKDSPNCQEQTENYSKIKKSALGTLGALIIKPQERKQIQQDLINKEGINFVDPGYSFGEDGPKGMLTVGKKTSQRSKQKPKKLISPLEAKNKDKKVLEGPKKSEVGKNKSDSLQTDLLQIKSNNKQVKSQAINLIDFATQQNKQSVDLLGGLQQKKQVPQSQISFQQLLQAQKRKKNKQFDFTL